MGVYSQIINAVDVYIIHCLPLIIFFLLLLKVFRKGKPETLIALNIVRWVIIIYTAITTSAFLASILLPTNSESILLSGPYRFAYWTMLISSTLLPFTLLFKKIGQNSFYLLFIAFMMNCGLYFERYVILVTSFHMDYSPYESDFRLLLIESLSVYLAQSIVITALIYGTIFLYQKVKNK